MSDFNRTQSAAINRAKTAQERLNKALANADEAAAKRNAAVRECVREHRISQKRLAHEIGVSRSMIYKILTPASVREAS